MRVFTLFIVSETLASVSRLPHATRDWTQAEMTSWNQLCTEIQELKGNGSGFIEKLHRGKSLTHLRELINSEKNIPNYDDDYSGEYEEIEEILYDVPSADYAMLNDVDSSFEDFDMKLPYQYAEDSIEAQKVSEERDPRTVPMTPTTTVPATRLSTEQHQEPTEEKTEMPHLTPQEIRKNRKVARDECKANFAANTIERRECIDEVNARDDGSDVIVRSPRHILPEISGTQKPTDQLFTAEEINSWKSKISTVLSRRKRYAPSFENYDYDGTEQRVDPEYDEEEEEIEMNVEEEEDKNFRDYFGQNWIDILLKKLENGTERAVESTQSKEEKKNQEKLAAALDTISRFVMGEKAYKKLKEEATEDFLRYKHKSCNVMSDEFWKDNKPELTRSSRSFPGSDKIEPEEVFAAIEFGEIMLDGENQVKQIKYYKVVEKSPLTMSNTVVAVLGSLMGFLVLCVVVLVARHHGRNIARGLDPTRPRGNARPSQKLKVPAPDSYEDRLAQKRELQQRQEAIIKDTLNDQSTYQKRKQLRKNQVLPGGADHSMPRLSH